MSKNEFNMQKIISTEKPDKSKLTQCPICNGELYSYSLMGIMITHYSYCPKCDIVRLYMMSMPFLCDKCFSQSYYEKNGENYCWFCNNNKMISLYYKEAKERGLFETEGFKLSATFRKKEIKCKHERTKNIRHNETIFKFICEDCGDLLFVMVPKWLQEEKNIVDTIPIKNGSDKNDKL